MEIKSHIKSPLVINFKGVREDRNTVSQLKENNNYSLTEPNQRRINEAINSLAKQRGEENIVFLLDIGKNLKYQTNISNGNTNLKNDWSKKLKEAAEESLYHSNPILKDKYQPQINETFGKKPLNQDEVYLEKTKDTILKSVEGNSEADNIKKNLEYFIVSTETPIEHKKYVMSRLEYFMSPEYHINPQLKDKKPQVLSEIANDIALNTLDKDIPNIKSINQKTHGMCAAIAIVRKAVAYEDKPNFVDAILSELDNSDKVMIYDRQNLGSGKRIPVKKIWIDYNYAQERGYRIIDASTLQWMNIGGMYGAQNENLYDYNAFDKNNFDAFHDAFFTMNFADKDLMKKQSYFQAMTKAEEDIKTVKSSEIKGNIKEQKNIVEFHHNIELLEKRNRELKKTIKNIMPNSSTEEQRTALQDITKLYQPLSADINKLPKNLQQYAFIPNEQDSQKQKKIEKYFKDNHSKQVNSDKLAKNSLSLMNNLIEIADIDDNINGKTSMSKKVARARKLYEAEAIYRAAITIGLKEKDVCTDRLVYYNIPDRETRIANGLNDVIDRIENKNDKKLLEHFSKQFEVEPDDKEAILGSLTQLKNIVDYMLTDGLDQQYKALGFGSRVELLINDITDSINDIENGNKDELDRSATCLAVKDKNKKGVLKRLYDLRSALEENPQDQNLYIDAFNKMGNKDQMNQFIDVYVMFRNGIIQDSESKDMYIEKFKSANNMDEASSPEDVLNVLNNIGANFNTISETIARIGSMLEVPNDDGTPYYTVNSTSLVLKKMENEGDLIPVNTMEKLQSRFAKIDKIRSSDEFASRQGKISDPSLYKFTKEEKEAIKQIDKKLNKMYSHVKQERNYAYKQIKKEMGELSQYVGTNSGSYWVYKDGGSGLYNEQQIKIFDELTDRPHKEVEDINDAVDIIKTTPHSGISSSHVFHDKYGGHAMYVADVVKDEHTGKDIVLHDNSWGASEHENTWIDSDGNMRTDYSDNRGGEFGYITNQDWRNGNFVENLTYKKGHISPENVENKTYKKINPTYNNDNDFTLMPGIILEGVSPEYKQIAGSLKDEFFVPESIFIGNLEKHAKNMTKKEIKAAIYKNNSLSDLYKNDFNNIIKRITPTEFNKGITSESEYNALDDNDPIKLAFEKAAIRNSYEDATMYKELGKARTMNEVRNIKERQRKKAMDDFYYTFNKNSATEGVFLAAAHNHGEDFLNALTEPLEKYGISIDSDTVGNVIHNMAILEGDEQKKYDGSVRTNINLFLERASKQFDENLGSFENSNLAKEEFLKNLEDVYEKNIYFNKEDLKLDTDKQKGIRMWIDDTFEPKSDEEFVNIFRMLQDMPKIEFDRYTTNLTDKYLGMKEISGYELLRRVQNANVNATNLLRNVVYYDVFADTIDMSKTKENYKLKKLERNKRGAYYQGSRTFDDLYRTFSYSLSTLEYDKMFNKYKDDAYRKYGALPSYPKITTDNTPIINEKISTTFEIINQVQNTISEQKNCIYNIQLTHLLDDYRKSIPSDRVLTKKERNVLFKMTGDFISANLTDPDLENCIDNVYNMFELSKDAKIGDYNVYIDSIVNTIKLMENANNIEDFKEACIGESQSLKEYFDSLFNTNIIPKYFRTMKEDVNNLLSLEKTSRRENNGIDKNRELLELQLKIAKNSSSNDKKGMIEDFIGIIDAVNKSKVANNKEKTDTFDKNIQIHDLHKLSDKYLEKYVQKDMIPILRADFNDWFRSELIGGSKKKVSEEELMKAREKFDKDFRRCHITSNPSDVLENFLLLSAKDAEPQKQQITYKQYLQQELDYAKLISIQDSLIEAVQNGNAAHVKEYFDEYDVTPSGYEDKYSMNSDEAINYMVNSLFIRNNFETAKMFVEKLGLGERVLKIERNTIKDINPKSKIDEMVTIMGDFYKFTNDVAETSKDLVRNADNIDNIEDLDKAILKTKKEIVKSLKYSNDKKSKKYVLDALNDAKEFIEEKPNVVKSAVIASRISTAINSINSDYNSKIKDIQDTLNLIHMVYGFLENIQLPEHSTGKSLQESIAKEHAEFKDYSDKKLQEIAQEHPGLVVSKNQSELVF